MSEHINNNMNGLIVPPKDPIALATAITIALQNDTAKYMVNGNKRSGYIDGQLC
jgi:hypothetical protein